MARQNMQVGRMDGRSYPVEIAMMRLRHQTEHDVNNIHAAGKRVVRSQKFDFHRLLPSQSAVQPTIAISLCRNTNSLGCRSQNL